MEKSLYLHPREIMNLIIFLVNINKTMGTIKLPTDLINLVLEYLPEEPYECLDEQDEVFDRFSSFILGGWLYNNELHTYLNDPRLLDYLRTERKNVDWYWLQYNYFGKIREFERHFMDRYLDNDLEPCPVKEFVSSVNGLYKQDMNERRRKDIYKILYLV